ncbi:MAG: alpha/beta hydrolase family protein [Planctomycetales bacterium]
MRGTLLWGVIMLHVGISTTLGQEYGPPDRDAPGDPMVQESLAKIASRLHGTFADDLKSLADWESRRAAYREEYLYMLGLSPLPERNPLKPTITGTLTGDGFVVDNLHYQSRPGLYVTANLYRPDKVGADERLPAVLYVCGHSGRGRDGNKTAFQSHGMWFARHGYICLVVDTLQLGEIAAIHHGTYRENRWWWHSRGYTSAGVECWNGVRGIDYLVSRSDVDRERIAVTGISGGGAATFWIAAADERVRVAVPVSGMADLPSYVTNRVINGHCDCMFLYNTFEWPWTRIAGLVAPRPLLFVNSDQDAIFPMDANERVINQLERLYSLYGAGDRVDSVVSVGGHAYRQDIHQAVYRFINTHLKDDSRIVTDSEVDLVEERPGQPAVHPIEPRRLRVFPTDGDLPADQLNTTIDEHFVPAAQVAVPAMVQFAPWQKQMRAELRRVVFRTIPEQVAAARVVARESSPWTRLQTQEGINVRVEALPPPQARPARVLLVVANTAGESQNPNRFQGLSKPGDLMYHLEPRGIGESRWTVKNPPNYVARSHVLLGRTVDTGRVRDVLATARYLREIHPDLPLHVAGRGAAGLIAAYAALWEPEIGGLLLDQPPATHMDPGAPQFLNILRVADAPDLVGLLAPRPVTILSRDDRWKKTAAIYAAAGAKEKLSLEEHHYE